MDYIRNCHRIKLPQIKTATFKTATDCNVDTKGTKQPHVRMSVTATY